MVEIRSPGDDSYAKLPFYAERGITEVLMVHEDRRVELYRLGEGGAYELLDDPASTVLGVTFTTVDGPKLGMSWGGGTAEV